MNKEKQIEEMERCKDCIHYAICIFHLKGNENKSCPHFENNAGYRKQIEGEWIKQKPNPEAMKAFHELGLGKGMSVNSIYWTCNLCGNWGMPHHKYCSNCGAKMKGGAE